MHRHNRKITMTAAPSVQVFTPDIPKAGRITLAAFALFVIGWLIYIEFTGGLDFNVYRFGAMTIFDNDGMHKDLYARNLLEYGDFRLPFTYPPFAALVFLPFAFLPAWVGIAIMYAISIGVAWWLATLIYNYAADRGYSIPFQERLGTYGIIAALTFIIIMTGPWRRGLSLIQINPIILTLVLADFIRPATRIPRGALIGIAGGIKLTPLAFGLILLMRKDWRGILTLGASFGTTILLGFIFLPQQAVTFWTSAVSDSGRGGGWPRPSRLGPATRSLEGGLGRWGRPGGPTGPARPWGRSPNRTRQAARLLAAEAALLACWACFAPGLAACAGLGRCGRPSSWRTLRFSPSRVV